MITPTHSSRVGQAWKSDTDVFLYTIIMLFNTAMTFITSLWNSATNRAEGIEEQSICSGLNKEEDKVMQPIYDMPSRTAVYSLFIIYYILISLIVIGIDLYANHIEKHGRCTLRIVSPIVKLIANLFLLVAGALYLGGDNILLLYRTYNNQTPFGPANDVRSHVVAISLASMIMSNIVFSAGNSLYEHFSARKDDNNVVFVELSARKDDVTSKALQWDLLYSNDSAIMQEKITDLNKSHSAKEHQLNLSLTNPTDNESVNVGLSLSEELATSGTLQLIMANDKSHADLSKDLALLHYDYRQSSPTQPYVNIRKKYVYAILIWFFKRILGYALIADAIYTSILDEITHQDTKELEGCACRESAVAAAHAAFWTLSGFWMLFMFTLILIAVCTYTCKGHRCLPSYFDTKFCSCCDTLFCSIYCCDFCTKCGNAGEDEGWSVTNKTSKRTGWFALLVDLKDSLELLVEVFNKCSKCKESYVKTCGSNSDSGKSHCGNCFISWVVLFFILLLVIGLPVVLAFVCFLLAVLLISSFVVALLLLQTCGMCCLCYGYKCFRKKHNFNLYLEGYIDQDCERSARYAARFLPHVFMIYLSVAVILFLPLYLIQDNKFPWVCYIQDKNSGMNAWYVARYTFIGIVAVTTVVVSVTNFDKLTFRREERLQRPAPKQNVMTIPPSEIVDSQPEPLPAKYKLNANDPTNDSENVLGPQRPAFQDRDQPASRNHDQPAFQDLKQSVSQDDDQPGTST